MSFNDKSGVRSPNSIGLPVPSEAIKPTQGADPCQPITDSGASGTVTPVDLPAGVMFLPGKK
jgi:hypothetical protein